MIELVLVIGAFVLAGMAIILFHELELGVFVLHLKGRKRDQRRR